MSMLEDRLREALHDRAGQTPVSPDAWPRTQARAARRGWRWPHVRAGRWTGFAFPAAAAVAVVVIVAGASLLAGHRGPSGAAGASSQKPAPAASTSSPPGRGNYEMQSAPPVTAVVRVKLIVDGQPTWTFVWFGYLKNGGSEGLVLCTVTDGDGYDGDGGCEPADVPAGQVAYTNGPDGDMAIGTSSTKVTSVSAQWSASANVTGVVVSGRGFPVKVWAVAYPARDGALVTFRGASGAELGHLTMASQYPAPGRPRSGGITVFRYPAGTVESTAGTMTAYLLNGTVIDVHGTVVGFWDSDNGSVISYKPVSASPPVVNVGGNYLTGATEAEYFGYARQNVRRVALVLPDGTQFGAQTVTGWAASGLRLWSFPVPVSDLGGKAAADATLIGYDAAGQVVWQGRVGQAS